MFGNGESTVLYKYILVPGDFSFVQEGKVLLEIYLRTLHISKYMTVESVLHAAELRLRGNFESRGERHRHSDAPSLHVNKSKTVSRNARVSLPPLQVKTCRVRLAINQSHT